LPAPEPDDSGNQAANRSRIYRMKARASETAISKIVTNRAFLRRTSAFSLCENIFSSIFVNESEFQL
jgi:hypothetical protein